MMTSWDEIKGEVKDAYDKIDSAYKEHVLSAVDKVKERPLLNSAVKTALPLIPIIGPILRNLYDNIGGGTTSEEDKAKQILDFLGELEKQSKEQFDRIAKDLGTNRDVITDAVNQNKIAITDLISKSSTELLRAIAKVKEDTIKIRDRVGKIQEILEKQGPVGSEPKRNAKPSTFHGESKIFVGRTQDIDTIKNYFFESNLPVSIIGEGGIGKSALAYQAMHKCDDIFDLVIPVYFGSFLTFESFLLEIV